MNNRLLYPDCYILTFKKVLFIYRYVEEHIQKTGVAIETQGFTFITSGRKRESLTVRKKGKPPVSYKSRSREVLLETPSELYPRLS